MFSISASSAIDEFVDVADDRRNGVQLRPLRRAPTPLAGDNHKSVTYGRSRIGCRTPRSRDRLGSSSSACSSNACAAVRVAADPRDLDLTHPAPRLLLGARAPRAASPSSA